MYERIGKRIFDVVFSLVAVVTLLPIFLIIAILIFIFDDGPVLFAQQRSGIDGREFRFYKFRSLPVNTASLPSDRIGELQLTWVGRMIRRTNLDELPQLLNILAGDMSVVGPRPPIPGQTDLLYLRQRNGAIELRPGLTGLAQINSYDGMSVEEKAEFDGKYARTVSFWNDLKIIVGTFSYLLKRPPVY